MLNFTSLCQRVLTDAECHRVPTGAEAGAIKSRRTDFRTVDAVFLPDLSVCRDATLPNW